MAKLAPTSNDVWLNLDASSNLQRSGSCNPVSASTSKVKSNDRIVMQDRIDYQLVEQVNCASDENVASFSHVEEFPLDL
jgi:hypothetical protein